MDYRKRNRIKSIDFFDILKDSAGMKTMKDQIKKGHYLLNSKYNPIGANRVDYQIRGDLVNINHAGWRKASSHEINQLLEATKRTSL